MARTSSSNTTPTLSEQDRQTLLALAITSIERGLEGERMRVRSADYSEPLRRRRASFVTVRVEQELRGCIGSIEPRRVLALDVAKNAYAAAFDDPRFSALTRVEFERLHVHISVLSTLEPVKFVSESDLIRQLRPGIDGVLLEAGSHRATYLPSVWESLSDPQVFLRELKRKAGLDPDYWSTDLQVQLYTTENIS
jgi:uncharacterized protein